MGSGTGGKILVGQPVDLLLGGIVRNFRRLDIFRLIIMGCMADQVAPADSQDLTVGAVKQWLRLSA